MMQLFTVKMVNRIPETGSFRFSVTAFAAFLHSCRNSFFLSSSAMCSCQGRNSSTGRRHEGGQLHPALEQVPGHPHAAAVCSEALAQGCGLCRGADSSTHLAG